MKTLKFYLQDRTRIIGEDGCVISLRTPKSPYPTVMLRGRRTDLRRVVWELAHGAPPKKGARIRSTCGKDRCINPEHLTVMVPKEFVGLYQPLGSTCAIFSGGPALATACARRMRLAVTGADSALRAAPTCGRRACVNPRHMAGAQDKKLTSKQARLLIELIYYETLGTEFPL